MVKRIIGFFAVFLLIFSGAALDAEEISLSIRYQDLKVYYLDSDPILVHITLKNNGPGPFRFKLAEERAFSLDFDVRTTTNRPVEAADLLLRRRNRNQQVYFREILVEAGESFSFTEDLREYALISKSGAYVVQALIYPELWKPGTDLSPVTAGAVYELSAASQQGNPETALVSNRLSLTVRPPSIPGPDGVPLALDQETNAVLVRENLPPDEVVNFLLSARQKGQWEKFFLYFDIEAMIARDSQRLRQWRAESEEGRRMMINRYREELQAATIDNDIATIPTEFTIERTSYNAGEGTVTVLEYFRNRDYTERKRYTYYLRRQDNIWNIVDYTVVNLGTE